MGKSDKKRAKTDILYTLRKQYDNFLEEEKQRKARNEYILGSLGNIWRASSATRRNNMPVIATSHSPENIFRTKLDNVRGREDNQYPTRDMAILPMTTADKFISEQIILAEIRKKYILIPKIEANSIVNQPESVTLEENYNLVDNDNNWKAKYDILKDLVKPHDNIQTQEQSKETTIETNSEVDLNNVNLKEVRGFPLQNKELPERDIPLRELQECETHVSNQRKNSRSLTFVTKPNETEFVNETNDKFQSYQSVKKVGDGKKSDTVRTLLENSETSNNRNNYSQLFNINEFPGHYKEDNQEYKVSNVKKMPLEDHSIGYNTVEKNLNEMKLSDQTTLSSTEQTYQQAQFDNYEIANLNVEPENKQGMGNDVQNRSYIEQNYGQLYESDQQPDEYFVSRIKPENNRNMQLSDQNSTVDKTEQNYQQSYEINTQPDGNFVTNETPEQFNGMQLAEKNTPVSYTEQHYEQPFEYDPQTDNYVVTEQGVDHVEDPHKLISNAENTVRQIDYQYSAHENEPVLSQQDYDENNYYNEPVKTEENVSLAEPTYPQDCATVNPPVYAAVTTVNENNTNVTENPLNLDEAIQEFNQENQEMFYSEQTNYQEGNDVVQQEYQNDSQETQQYYEDHQQGQQYTAEYVDNDITQQQYDPNYAEQYQGYNQEQTYVQEPVQHEQINYETINQNEPEQENPKEEIQQQLDVEDGYVGNEAQSVTK